MALPTQGSALGGIAMLCLDESTGLESADQAISFSWISYNRLYSSQRRSN